MCKLELLNISSLSSKVEEHSCSYSYHVVINHGILK